MRLHPCPDVTDEEVRCGRGSFDLGNAALAYPPGPQLPYDGAVHASGSPPPTGDEWVGLCPDALPIASVHEWLVRPDCGALVVFCGTARDHSEGRDGVELLSYEAYEAEAGGRIAEVVAVIRRRWPVVGRVVVLHRTGDVEVGKSAVVVGISAPHRDVAFEAARFGIDAVKASVPIWKRERWSEGDDWGLDGADLVAPSAVPAAWAGAGAPVAGEYP